jgi:Tfp pilus assembly protein PilE
MLRRDAAGFTAIEILIVLLLIGTIVVLGAKRQSKTVREARARDAVRRLVAVGLANRRYADDNDGRFSHRIRTAATLDGCGRKRCEPCRGEVCDSCALVACRYLDAELAASKHYRINAVSPLHEAGCGIAQPESGAPMVACARSGEIRWKGEPAEQGESPQYDVVYTGWGYSYHADGSVRNHFGAPVVESE